MRLRHVRQEDDYGCGFAVLAMLTGRTYREVRSRLREAYCGGLTEETLFNYLCDEGYYVRQRRRSAEYRRPLKGWTEPFARLHLCMVYTSLDLPGAHYVVMRADGAVLDPAEDSPRTLADYPRVLWVWGLWRPRK